MESNQLPVQSDKEKSREQRFVETVIERCLYDKGQAARLRRADNPQQNISLGSYWAGLALT